MSSAGAVRAGETYVEVSARDGAFHQAMGRVQSRLQALASSLQRIGTTMSLGGAALGAPLVLAARQAAGFQDALLGMQGAAGLSQEQVAKLSDEAKRLSKEMGIDPTRIANAFLELTKAGMSVEDVLKGAGRSAVEFAKVSGVDTERAAVFMKTSMNTFGISAQEAVDTLSAAADSSETSIAGMVEAFSQVGSAGQSFNQSLFGISQAMAALAKSNIMGEEAGTAIKTMLTKLVAPTDDAKEALAELGLTIADFRDEQGKLLPMGQIAGVFEGALGRMGGDPEGILRSQKALVDVFEQRGIKVITAFANIGEKGFAEIARQMQDALPVSQKFSVVMSGISGQFDKLGAATQRIAIAFGEAIDKPLGSATKKLAALGDVVANLIDKFPEFAIAAASIAAGMVAIGTAAITLSLAVKAVSAVGAALALLASPAGAIALVTIAIAGLVAYMTGAFTDLEGWGNRLSAIWQKLGVYIAAAFDSSVRENMTALLAGIDADVAKWEANRQAQAEKKKALSQEERAAAAVRSAIEVARPGQNAARPDQRRDGMGFDPTARAAAREELAKADAEYEQQSQEAVTKQTNAFFQATQKAGELGRAGEDAAKRYMDGLMRLGEQLQAGILNPPSYEQAASALQDVFDEQIRAIESAPTMPPGGGPAIGTFGDGTGLGVAPQLNDVQNRIAAGVEKMVGQLANINQNLAANKPQQAGAGVAGVAQGLAAQQLPGVVQPAAAGAIDRVGVGVGQAANAAQALGDAQRVIQSLDGGFKSVVNAITAHMKVSEAGNGILKSIQQKIDKPGLVFV